MIIILKYQVVIVVVSSRYREYPAQTAAVRLGVCFRPSPPRSRVAARESKMPRTNAAVPQSDRSVGLISALRVHAVYIIIYLLPIILLYYCRARVIVRR